MVPRDSRSVRDMKPPVSTSNNKVQCFLSNPFWYNPFRRASSQTFLCYRCLHHLGEPNATILSPAPTPSVSRAVSPGPPHPHQF